MLAHNRIKLLLSGSAPCRLPYESSRGFTLIELLVVIAIIGLLSSIVLASLNTARSRAFDAKHVTDITAIQTALEMYYEDHYAYPVEGSWNSQCLAWGHVASPNDVIPGLAPTYIANLPSDPQMDAANSACCYLYLSNGTDYKFLAHGCPTSNKCYGSGEASGGFYDPVRPTWACQISTAGGAGW